MRTKTLLIAGAVLAATVISSEAQTVYSVNVVGYANVILVGGGGYTLVANPFDDGNGNHLTNLLANLPAKSQVITWNGTTYDTAIGKGGSGWASDTNLPPGLGFFVKNGSGASPNITNTFVGTIVSASGSTVTNALANGYNLVGNQVPFADDATTSTNINLANTLAAKSQLIDWNSGSQQFDTAVGKGGAGWGGTFPVGVGQGFFVNNKTATNWTQTLVTQ